MNDVFEQRDMLIGHIPSYVELYLTWDPIYWHLITPVPKVYWINTLYYFSFWDKTNLGWPLLKNFSNT